MNEIQQGREVAKTLRYEGKIDHDTLMWGPIRNSLLAYITALEEVVEAAKKQVEKCYGSKGMDHRCDERCYDFGVCQALRKLEVE